MYLSDYFAYRHSQESLKVEKSDANNNITKKLVNHDTDIGAVLNDEWVDGCVFFSVVVRIKV